VLAVAVTLGLAVHAVSQLSIRTLRAEAKVTALDAFVHVALIPRLVGSGELMTLIVSPGAVLAAVAPDEKVFHLLAKDNPSLASFPPSASR
jgi:hypothetical protein